MRTRIEGPLDVDLDALLVMLHEADQRAIDAILADCERLDLDALLASLDSNLEALLENLTKPHFLPRRSDCKQASKPDKTRHF